MAAACGLPVPAPGTVGLQAWQFTTVPPTQRPAATAQSFPFCYTLVAPAGTVYGNWQVTVSGTMIVVPVSSPATGTGPAAQFNASYYSQAWSVQSILGTRTYTDAIGQTQTTQITGPLDPQYVYAPSALSVPVGNTNLIYTPAGSPLPTDWLVDAGGLAFWVSSAPTGNSPGMAGFPTNSLFNQSTMLCLTASNSSATLTETGYGPQLLFPQLGLAGPGVYTPNSALVGVVASQATIGQGASCTAYTAPAPSYITQSLCYVLYPDETAQNGQWSVTFSALLYTTPVPITIPANTLSGRALSSVPYQAYVIYSMANVSRTYVDQYGDVFIVSGAQLQGIGGDGGTNNLLYTSVNSSDVYGGLFDDDGFSVTWLNGATAVTAGDPTGAYGINFYYEDNYREAAEPWHQDNEFGGAGTTLTVQAASSVLSCTSIGFQAVAKPANYNASLSYAFCASLSGSGGWQVAVSALLQVTPTNFSSNGSNNTVLYKVGTGISGSISFVSGAGQPAQQASITGLIAPGNGYNSNKLYSLATSASYFDGGGWAFSVSPAVMLPGAASATSIVRLYPTSSSAWQLQAIPSFVVTAASTQATVTAQPATAVTCTPANSSQPSASSSSGSAPAGGASSPSSSSGSATGPATSATGTATSAGAATGPSSSSAAATGGGGLPSSSSSSSSSTSAAAAATAGGSSSSSSLSGGDIAGIVIGSVVGALLLLACLCAVFFLAGRGKSDEKRERGSQPASSESSTIGSMRHTAQPARAIDTESSQVEMA